MIAMSAPAVGTMAPVTGTTAPVAGTTAPAIGVVAPTPALGASVDPATVGLGLLTQLGDVWFVTVLALVLYWVGPRTPLVGDGVDRGRQATVLGAVFLGIVVAVALKTWVGAPRPPAAIEAPTIPAPTVESVTAWLAGADGPAFPSGHAVLVTVGWGGLAWGIRAGSMRRRAGIAAAVIAIVAGTRIALGLHTFEQVLAGLALGLVALALVLALGTPRRAFGLALGVALIGVGAVGPVPDLLVAAGLAGGGLLAWHLWAGAILEADRAGALVTAAIGAVTVLPSLVVLSVLAVHPLLHVGVSAVVGLVMVALPLVERELVDADP